MEIKSGRNMQANNSETLHFTKQHVVMTDLFSGDSICYSLFFYLFAECVWSICSWNYVSTRFKRMMWKLCKKCRKFGIQHMHNIFSLFHFKLSITSEERTSKCISDLISHVERLDYGVERKRAFFPRPDVDLASKRKSICHHVPQDGAAQ